MIYLYKMSIPSIINILNIFITPFIIYLIVMAISEFEGHPRRQVSPILRTLFKYDELITKNFITWITHYLPLNHLGVYVALEIFCHGFFFLAIWIAFSWLFDKPHLVEMQSNIFSGLIIVIIATAIIKTYVRRRRPVGVDNFLRQMNIDIFSFPSGHVSLAVFVVYYFSKLWPVNFIFHLLLVAWAISIGISRVLLRRVHLGDVLGGVVLGLLVGLLVELLCIEGDTQL